MTEYTAEVSETHEHDEWNAFLANVGLFGHHEQTTCWADIQRPNGWRAVRIAVRREGSLVGGAQLLIQRKKRFGSIVYLRWGPCFADDDPEVRNVWIARLQSWAKDTRATYVVVNPCCSSDDIFVNLLTKQGYRLKREKLPPWSLTKATLIIDLSEPLDVILYDMRRELRREIRIGTKSGLEFREGNKEDLAAFFDLMKRIAERRGVSPIPSSLLFLQRLWKAFHPHGWVRLFLAKKPNGVLISTGLVFTFGSTVRFWKYGWTGEDPKMRPNQFLYWNLIKWSQENGFKYFDIIQVEPSIAECLRKKRPLTAQQKAHPLFGPTLFKLGFGGQVLHYPGAYYRFYNPLAAALFELVIHPLTKISFFKKLLHRSV